MLKLVIPAQEAWNEQKQEFITTKETHLVLEHSLVSLSKWESKWKKPFLTDKQKTFDETIDYMRCMTITQNIDPDVYYCVTNENIEAVNKYIEDSMTATTITRKQQKGRINGEQVTSELVYYWMVALNIPFECQKWHLNRLITLIEICNIKSEKPKKMGRKSIYSQNSALNAARRAQLNSRG